MAGLTERLAIVITADSKAAVRELQLVGKTANTELGKAENAAQRTQLQLTKFGVGAVAASAVAATGLYSLGQAASDMEQAVGGSEAIFGSASKTIQDFGNTSADAFGISRTAALQLTAATGAMLKGFGFTQQAAADTSVRLAKLGADLAATFGGRPEEAVSALGAALRGEFDPLERFGVSLNVTQASLRAVELGLASSASSASLNAKAQGALSLIFERSAAAQGQFARESDTAAGRMARNAATFSDLKAEIGQGVLPAMNALLGGINDVIGAFGNLTPQTQSVIGTIATVGTVVTGAVGALSFLAGQTDKVRGRLTDATGALNNFGKAAVGLGALGATIAALQTIDAVMAGITDHAGLAEDALKGILAAKGPEQMAAEFQEMARQVDSSRGTLEELGSTVKDLFGGNSQADSGLKAFKTVLAQSVPAAERLVEALEQRWGAENVAQYRAELEKTTAANKQLVADQKAVSGAVNETNSLFGVMGPVLDRAASSIGAVNAATAAAAARAAEAASSFIAFENAITGAFSAGTASERSALSLADANQAVADAQSAVAGTGVRAAGGSGAAGNSALDAERKTRAYEDALRDVDDAQRAVTDSQDRQADAARAVEDATRGVADAERAVTDASLAYQDAIRGVTEAQKGVEEAHRRVASATRAVEDAGIGLADAQRNVVDVQNDAREAAASLVKEQENLRRVTQGYGRDSDEAADAQERLNGAVRDSRRAVLAVADAQEKLRAAQETAGSVSGWGLGADAPEMVAANRDVLKAQLDLEEAQARVASTSDDASEAQRKLTGTLTGYADGSDEVSDAQKRVRDAQDKATQSSIDAEKATRDVEDRQIALSAAIRGVTEAQDGVEEAHRRVSEAAREVAERSRGVEDAERGVEDAHRRVTEATKGVDEANRNYDDALRGVEDANFRVREAEEARTARLGGGGGGGAAVRDQAQLERDLEGALLDQRDAYEASAKTAAEKAVADAQVAAALRGETIPAQDLAVLGAKAYIEELGELINTLEPGSPLRKSLEEYRDGLLDIPPEISTKINLDTREAAAKLQALNDAVVTDFAQAPVDVPAARPFSAPRAPDAPAAPGTVGGYGNTYVSGNTFVTNGTPEDIGNEVAWATRKAG